jgi:phosphohistidine phosphatase
MPKKLFIIRHAKSDWSHEGMSDFDRPLNERGMSNAPFMADKIVEAGHAIDFILTSPANRALTTAGFFKRRLGLPDSRWDTERKIYEADVKKLLAIVNALNDDYACVMLFGHNPGVSALVHELTGAWVVRPTCGIAEIEIPCNSWSMVSAGACNLISFDFPKRYV